MNYAGHEVLDLFAGTGVGVAVRSLGAHEHGVEIMPEALLTREANGLDTAYKDVWDAELAEALNITVAEASTLQSYPTSEFIWKGVKTKQFLQIGNAVPPLLARAVLEELWK